MNLNAQKWYRWNEKISSFLLVYISHLIVQQNKKVRRSLKLGTIRSWFLTWTQHPSMGRQHTPEKKLAANRGKSKQHYEKYFLFLFIHYISDWTWLVCSSQVPIGHVFVSGARFVETDLTLSLRFTFDWTTEPIITKLF